ncbi:MAG TPA: KTSC domain-containing protein [Negativicutes bacterium]|nr:KTSC domain-containing protein [Negativicutes bacterium]
MAGENSRRREKALQDLVGAKPAALSPVAIQQGMKGGMPMRGTSLKSNLRSVRYDAETMVLEVEFHAGGLCEYHEVPLAVYQALMAAASRDAYFEKNIRHRFRHRHFFKI